MLRLSQIGFALLCLISVFNAFKVYARDMPQTIRSIEIRRLDIFPEISGKPRFLYELANDLHIVTKEKVIRRELLFKPGDALDPELLAESERNLRELAFIGEVHIHVENQEGQFADVVVVTQDQWSTLTSAIVNRGGGRTILGGALEEFNFLGLGKQIFTEVRHEISEGTQYTLNYTDPQLFFTRWTTQETFISGPFIRNFSAQFVRPFFSLDTRWAGGVAGNAREETLRLFDQGEEASRLELDSKGFEVFGARSFGGRFKKTGIRVGYRFLNRDFSSLAELTTTPLPADELLHTTSARLSLDNLDFIEEKRIDKFSRTEDLTLGNSTSITFGRSGFPVTVGVERFELSFSRREAHRIFTEQYLFAVLSFQTLFEKDTIGSVRLQYYNKLLPQQTLAFNFELDYSEDLEVSRQFLLGGDSGLRGYPAREFSGDKRLLINFEDRIFSSVNILTVALGGVLFLDMGNVWPAGEQIDLADLNYSVGFGLRLGYTKSPNSRVGRIDFGWPLNRGGGFGVVIGIDQVFSVN